MMSAKEKKLLLPFGVVVAVIACGAFLLPTLARSTNCGGNSAAITYCKDASLSLVLAAKDRGAAVSATNLTESERENFRHLSRMTWLGTATVLVALEPVSPENNRHQLLAVCSKPYDNVPQRMIGKAPLTHAVAYSDGSSGLISIDDFRKLDLKKFVDVKTLIGGTGSVTRSASLEQKF
jgi:hypothetical protein